MKKILFITAMLLGMVATTFSQDEDGGDGKAGGGKVEALKIAFLTQKLNLTTEEAQKFWPIYNNYIKEVRQTRITARQNKEKDIDTDEKLLNIRKKYDTEFGKALSKEKVNTFFRAEKEFGAFLQKELLERRQQRLDNRKQKLKG